jgi:hypothetical protein
VGGDWKEKRAYGIKIPKRRLPLVLPSEGKERKRKCFFFLHFALFFKAPVYNDPTENEKKKYTPFLNLCFRFENTEFRIISKHSHLFLFQHSVS